MVSFLLPLSLRSPYHCQILVGQIIVHPDPVDLPFLEPNLRARNGAIDYGHFFLGQARLGDRLLRYTEDGVWNKGRIVNDELGRNGRVMLYVIEN